MLAGRVTPAHIAALAFSCERAKVAHAYGAAESMLLDSIREAADRSGWPDELLPPHPWPRATPGSRIGAALSEWCRRSPRRVVPFFDEIDALQGDSLVSFLCQLRDGHDARPDGRPFPTSVILCGLRDVRDYKVVMGADPGRSNPTSPFNVVADSLRLGDFTAGQIAELYGQHTEATGQEFTKGAVERVFELTQGQPWLVNALAYELITKMRVTETVGAGHVDDAKERLIRQEGYHEAACQIILMAFLHRLVNGGGYLDREYAAGTKRLDVLVRWPYPGPDGERLMQREAMELKVWRAGEPDPLDGGLARLDRYLDRLSLDTGVLVVFDRRPEAVPWRERGVLGPAVTPSGREVTLLRV